MTRLAARLDRIREGFLAKAPEDAKAVMHRATEDLRASGIVDRLPQPGSPLPPFELEDTDGNAVRSDELLKGGPLVLTFYRGLW
jgi:cytochrome oxidase Cu insertion factor (SCO1/SenC/PrrC family)